ncbi:RNA-binding S4 domain-containing protein [Niabella drilacis]|uniref:Ribosome-associated heat shock protein Hsp15 n=1 Tax=Niabella drilacis (strain DSM 25811 / CCM 8410 / CCUG 62505 / LMG 26954 / E90) TaxID=1285928 RepID=A0A1G6VU41_NIADE|nr:RNA-binding S4 domain-containing protein [Niabella drilacis]SDD56346.1 ribosome-associated heat shock protein Hsp15 [Niabella drilacis]
MEKEKLRLDKYLWSIRLFKTRRLATDACNDNKVKYQEEPAKPGKNVHVGDVYDVRTEGRKWVIKVTGLLHTRVKYEEAIRHYTDLTPPEELEKAKVQAASFFSGKRLSKIGRPTKKERRDLDDFMEGEEG